MSEPTVEYKPPSRNLSDVEAGQVKVHSPSKGTIIPERRPSRIPVLFERAARTWWNPKFDSEPLETEFKERSFVQLRQRFQIALGYIILVCAAMCIFFACRRQAHWIAYVSGTVVLVMICFMVLWFTFTRLYKNYCLQTSVFLSVLLCASCMLTFVYDDPDLSPVGTFTGTIVIIIMMYTVIPMPLFLSVFLGVLYSVVLEVCSGNLTVLNTAEFIVGRALLHVCIHLIGIHIFFMAQIRNRSTFLKVCQSAITRRGLTVEKQLKQKMIYSLMPSRVAESIIRARDEEESKKDDDNHDQRQQKRNSSAGKVKHQKGVIKFRTFHMDTTKDVSILFADIVGFTKMSSNKTAEHLVGLLNNLFGRFDILCSKCGCEKISTLGDCYYSVSGCPDPRSDHARCSVEMGLAMCIAIQEFDEDYKEEVNMRVGVHTGTVLCGLVGTRRFKFDVWSHDVTLANTMESDGKPGLVHISDSTYNFVKDDYEVEKGEPVKDIRKHKVLIEYYNKDTQGYDIKHVQEQDIIETYFITGRKKPAPENNELCGSPELNKAAGDNAGAREDEAGDVTDHLMDKSAANHSDVQADGVSAATLIAQRDTSEADTENQKQEALMQQFQAQRDIREKTDKDLIDCMKDVDVDAYMYNLPINKVTLQFRDKKYEAQYRNNIKTHRPGSSNLARSATSLSMPRFSALCDTVVSLVFFCVFSVAIFICFPPRLAWLVFFALALMLKVVVIVPMLCDVCIACTPQHRLHDAGQFFSSWVPRHVFGAIMASFPAAAVYCNFSCDMFERIDHSDLFYCLLFVVSIIHYCNFTMLSSWMKSFLATIVGVILPVLVLVGFCVPMSDELLQGMEENTTMAAVAYAAVTAASNISVLIPAGGNDTLSVAIFSGDHPLKYEIVLNIIILLLLILFLNREFEIAHRFSFHGDAQAHQDSIKMQEEKDQADWLLHNIIPEHVVDVLKETSKYCKNHKDVGVIFAKIVNYDDFYDESFEGGKEYLRVLNELMGDFEDLFDDRRFKDVEKIKTIGACLMAASGLNPLTRNENADPNAHLYALMEFSMEMLEKLEQFNAEIFNFNFELAIGFNFGEVTAGVIGTSKLLYDIWGDTVNIASRMYSTGQNGKIQVTEDTATKLADKFEFEYRGKTFVKGKGDMSTYLLAKRKDGATWE